MEAGRRCQRGAKDQSERNARGISLPIAIKIPLADARRLEYNAGSHQRGQIRGRVHAYVCTYVAPKPPRLRA